MPKMKTKSGAKKRFKITATGKVLYAQRGKRHGMIKRTNKQVRNLRGTTTLFEGDADRDRKNRKRTFRALWIQRLNAAVREHGLTYSRFIDGLGKAGVAVDRKVLSDIAIREPEAFAAIVDKAKAALPADLARAA